MREIEIKTKDGKTTGWFHQWLPMTNDGYLYGVVEDKDGKLGIFQPKELRFIYPPNQGENR